MGQGHQPLLIIKQMISRSVTHWALLENTGPQNGLQAGRMATPSCRGDPSDRLPNQQSLPWLDVWHKLFSEMAAFFSLSISVIYTAQVQVPRLPSLDPTQKLCSRELTEAAPPFPSLPRGSKINSTG